MNAPPNHPLRDGPPSLELPDDELVRLLGQSIYPGAAEASIRMCVAYCRARRLDPLLKPVHIVPMSVKTGRKKANGYDEYEWRDVVMPGVGLYRINATRTGLLAGVDEPVFHGEHEMPGVPGEVVPAECSVTVWKLVGGARCAFTARERWVENYATAGRETLVPNAMWKRRRYAQLAKCAEAQALRKAFPEETGQAPVAEETFDLDLEGGSPTFADGSTVATFNVGRKQAALPAPPPLDPLAADLAALRPDLVPVPVGETPANSPPPALDPFVAAMNSAEKANGAPVPAPAPRAADGPVVGVGEVAYLRVKAKAAGVDLSALLAEQGGLVLERLAKADFERLKAMILAKIEGR